MISLPRFYAILDASCFSTQEALSEAAEELVNAGVMLVQYRDKSANARLMLKIARNLCDGPWRARAPALHGNAAQGKPRLIMNDRADICLAADFDGVHVGQDDLSPESARGIIGAERWLGVSTHNPQQVAEADKTSADYVAIGPVFVTASKSNPDPVIGLAGVRQARALTQKPLVAIGGITRENCRLVIDAGADSVAVISDLIRDPGKSAEEFLRILG
jgi:thiamine-phosphate pyrophosphorylase